MKLSRNVLVGSLAVSGMVLGAIAPALTAQAATTSGTIGTDGSVTHVDKGTPIGQLTNPDNGQLAIAYESADGAGDGEASAVSNASVKVVNGVLVLNEVPDFNFGSAVAGQTKNLVDNTRDDATAQGQDGNATGNLSVLESRQISDGTTGGATGFDLTAQLGSFVDASTGKTQTISTKGNFVLNLLPQSVTDGQDVITGLKTSAAALDASDASSTAAKSVMSVSSETNGASYKDGEYLAKFNAADSTTGAKAGATLEIPSDIKASSKGQVSSLNAPITWTLTAKSAATGA